MCWLADNLQLRSDQQEAIIAGSRLFERLLDQVRAERCQLLEQQGEQVEQRFSPQSSGGLQLAQDTAKQLQVLLRKECFLVSAACMFTGGVMDLEQVARAAVLCWPYVPQLFMLGPGIMRRMQEGQQKAQDPGSAAPTAE
jgi:predicted component of type VI protein secretion system